MPVSDTNRSALRTLLASLLLIVPVTGITAPPPADIPLPPPNAPVLPLPTRAPEADVPAAEPTAPSADEADSPDADAPTTPETEAPDATDEPADTADEPAGDIDQSEDEDEASQDEASRETEPEELPLDELRVFAEVFGRIKSDYVEPVDDRELLSAAIRGMLAGLDPHSAYLDADDYKELKVGTSGEFGGLGIEVGMEDGFVKVIAPIDDTPAQRAGIEAGDLIVRIDEKPVKGMSLDEAVQLMRGKPGTSIELTVVRDGEPSPVKMTIERDIIQVVSVKQRTLEPGFAYLRIANFQSRTTDDLVDAINKLKAESPDGIHGLVLDLRNNPGGVLNSAVGVSDAFLTEGLIVYTQGRDEESRLEFRAGPDDVLDGAPIVVLVNAGSASASEIVAGALQDQGRALIMGGDTFGKGSVQTIVPIDDDTALKITTARYYTPSGRSIQAHGIEPDITLARGTLELADEPDMTPLKEADLVRHLDDEADSAAESDENAEEKPLAAEDYQLAEALNVLKGLHILSRRTAPPETVGPER
jgi:carboxyl-terminal processing protease